MVEPLIFGWFAALARCAGCLMLLPGFSSARVPVQVRALMVVALSAAIVPFAALSQPAELQTGVFDLVGLLLKETFIGAMLAASARIFLLTVGFFATAVSSAIGLSGQLGASMIETDAEPALTTLLSMTTLLVLFALDFHHAIIAALAASYDLFPQNAWFDPSITAKQFVDMLAEASVAVFHLASPFLAFALLANLFIALINKLAPNLQIYFVAAPAVIIGGILLAIALIPVLQPMAEEAISRMARLP
jgi:flagellar biosynthesis protein FliR